MTARPERLVPKDHRQGKGASGIRDTSATDRVIDPAPRRRRRRLFAILGGALALLAILFVVLPAFERWSRAERTVPRERLRTAVVATGELTRDVAAQGRVVAAVSPTLYSPNAGIVALAVQAGDSVAAGDPLASVESPELDSRLRSERSALQSAEIELERQRIQARRIELENQQTIDLATLALRAAEREMRRAEDSHTHQVISQHDYEEAIDDLEAAGVAHRQAVEQALLESESLAFELETKELELERQRLLVEELERQVYLLNIRSPVDGVVGTVAVQDRQAVLPNQPIVTVVDLSAFEIEVTVPESYGDELAVGTPTEITYARESHAGEIASVSPEIRNGQVTARVRFTGSSPQGLRQNQRVSARIVIDHRPETVRVQRGPFFDSGGGRVAYVVEGDFAIRRTIVTGATSIDAIEILDGLEPGQEIVISDLSEFEGAETVFLTD